MQFPYFLTRYGDDPEPHRIDRLRGAPRGEPPVRTFPGLPFMADGPRGPIDAAARRLQFLYAARQIATASSPLRFDLWDEADDDTTEPPAGGQCNLVWLRSELRSLKLLMSYLVGGDQIIAAGDFFHRLERYAPWAPPLHTFQLVRTAIDQGLADIAAIRTYHATLPMRSIVTHQALARLTPEVQQYIADRVDGNMRPMQDAERLLARRSANARL